MFAECDGVILYTNVLFEGPALDLWQEWFGTRPVIAVGPMPPVVDLSQAEREGDPRVLNETETFLDRALYNFGPSSVIYVGRYYRTNSGVQTFI